MIWMVGYTKGTKKMPFIRDGEKQAFNRMIGWHYLNVNSGNNLGLD
jgi:hypothetical protein